MAPSVTPFRNVIRSESPSGVLNPTGGDHVQTHGKPWQVCRSSTSKAAAIDIGARFHVVAVPPELCDEPVQTFQAFTAISNAWRTGSCRWASRPWRWNRPACTGSRSTRFSRTVASRWSWPTRASARAVPGRKSDVNDAQWLQRLHACGLLRASFRPGRDIAALRAYLRLRERHLDYAAAHIQHMQKALTFMNLQLHHVVTDVTGVTGMRIIRAIVGGERDPDVLAPCATHAAGRASRRFVLPWSATTSRSMCSRWRRRWRCTTLPGARRRMRRPDRTHAGAC